IVLPIGGDDATELPMANRDEVPGSLTKLVLDPGPLVLVQVIAPPLEVLVPHFGDLDSRSAPQVARRPGFEIQIHEDQVLTLVHRPDRAQEDPAHGGPQALACKPPFEPCESRGGGQESAPAPASRLAEGLIPPHCHHRARRSVVSHPRAPSPRLPRGRGPNAPLCRRDCVAGSRRSGSALARRAAPADGCRSGGGPL